MLIRPRQSEVIPITHGKSGIMTPVIPGFDYRRVPVADGVSLNVAVAGSGPAVVLLHGFPRLT
nr:hypothetical protein GCM10020093_069960 [Planobispora longispora]